MRKLVQLFFLIVIGISMNGCAAIIKEMCTPNAAYTAGINDAQNGRDMQENYASICPARKGVINRAYRRGYRQGMQHRKPRRFRPYPWRHHRY